jgi:Cys-rich repeat protein
MRPPCGDVPHWRRVQTAHGPATGAVVTVLIAALLAVPSAGLGEDEPETMSEFIKRYGCTTVKGWAYAKPDELFTAWQKDVWARDATGAEQGIGADIAKRGDLGVALAQLPRIMSAVETLEEAAFGEPRKAAEILSRWMTTEALTTLGAWLGTGALGAVWTVCSEFGALADDLSREISGINVKAYSKMAEADPALLGPGGVEHYLDAYLHWNDMRPQTWRDWQTIKRRAHLAEYAKYQLNNKTFPQFPQWHQNERVVRAAAASLLQDVGRIVEATRRAKQLQGQLRAHAAALRRQIEVLQQFQGFLGTVKGMTCTDHVDELLSKCAGDIEQVNQNLLRAATDTGNLPKFPRSAAERLGERISDLDRRADHYGSVLERSLEKVHEYCAYEKESWKAARQIRDQAGHDAVAAEDAAARAETAADRACAAESLTVARQAAAQAQNGLLEAQRIATSVRDVRIGVQQLAAPEPVDFSDLRTAAADLEAEVAGLRRAKREFIEGRKLIMKDLASGEAHLRSLKDRCAEDDAAREIAQVFIDKKLGEFGSIRATLNVPLPEGETLDRLAEGAANVAARIEELEQRQGEERACLADVPDLTAIASEIQGSEERASTAAERAAGHVQRAEQCVTDLESRACATDDDCAEGQVCRDGACVAGEKTPAPCLSDAHCAKDQVCRDGACVAPEKIPAACLSDADCAEGQVCRDGACVAGEKRSEACVSDADCPEEQVCSQGSCVDGSGYEAEEEVTGDEAEKVARRKDEEEEKKRAEANKRAYKVGRTIGEALGRVLRGKLQQRARRQASGGSSGSSGTSGTTPSGGSGGTPSGGSGGAQPAPAGGGTARFAGTLTGSWDLGSCEAVITTEGEYEIRISSGGAVSGSMWNYLRGTWYDISGTVDGSGRLSASARCRVVGQSVCVQEISSCSLTATVTTSPKLQSKGTLDCGYCRGVWEPVLYR